MTVPKVEKRRYRKVICRMYADDKFLQLSKPQPNGQTLWTYLITGPHTTAVPGLFQAGEAQLAEALQWPLAGFRRAWQEIERLGMARADWKARVVWLPKAIKFNAPENPNVVKGWRDAIDEIPACALKAEALAQLALFLKGLGEGFLKPFLKAFAEPLLDSTAVGLANGLANQEQEQEQEKDPPTPHADARGGFGRITRAERQKAEQVRRNAFGCPHTPRCEKAETCIRAIVEHLRVSA